MYVCMFRVGSRRFVKILIFSENPKWAWGLHEINIFENTLKQAPVGKTEKTPKNVVSCRRQAICQNPIVFEETENWPGAYTKRTFWIPHTRQFVCPKNAEFAKIVVSCRPEGQKQNHSFVTPTFRASDLC